MNEYQRWSRALLSNPERVRRHLDTLQLHREDGTYFTVMINPKQYKKRLLDLEKKLEARADRDLENGRGELIDVAHDAGDASVSDVAVDSEFTQAELNSMILQQVQDALRRIDDGTFGKCLIDDGPIEKKRLDAVPWTPYCLKHQTLLEAAGRERNWTL